MAATVPAWGTSHSTTPVRGRRTNTQRSATGRASGGADRHETAARQTRGGASLPRSSRAAQRERMQARALHASHRQGAKARYAVFAVLGVLVAAIVLLLPGMSAEASHGTPESHATSVVTVNAGDSLWSVASRSMPDVDTRSAVIELRKANNLRGSDLVVGQQLVVPNP